MPLDHSPVKTRQNSKVNKDKPVVSRALSDSSLSAELSPDMNSAIQSAIVAAFNNESIVTRIVDLVAEKVGVLINENLNLQLKKTSEDLKELQVKYDLLQEQMNKQSEEAKRRDDEHEQYSRRNNLRVFGVKENNNEDTDQLVRDIFKNKLNIDVSTMDIDRSHRVGKSSSSAEGEARPRPILVKFVSYQTRRRVFDKKKQLKGTSITIREDLTAHRLKLLKQAADVHGYKNVWSMDGRIHWITEKNIKGTATWVL